MWNWKGTSLSPGRIRREAPEMTPAAITGGEGGIRTPGTRFSAYNGLARHKALLADSEEFGLYYIPQAVVTNQN